MTTDRLGGTQAFWVRTAQGDFPFHIVATDPDGRQVELSANPFFVPESVARDRAQMETITADYVAPQNETRRAAAAGGAAGRIRQARSEPAGRHEPCDPADLVRDSVVAHSGRGRLQLHAGAGEGDRAHPEPGGVRRRGARGDRSERAWIYDRPLATIWAEGNTLCYLRSFWEQAPFPACTIETDLIFVGRSRRTAYVADPPFLIAVVHPWNSSPKDPTAPYWFRADARAVHQLLGDDLEACRRHWSHAWCADRRDWLSPRSRRTD